MTDTEPVYSAALIDELCANDIDGAKRDAQFHRHHAITNGWITAGLCVGAAVCGAFAQPFL